MSDNSTLEPQSQLAELKVSGHTMTLDPGLYCIFSLPETPLPDPETGLPVVRIGPAPGRLAQQVELLGLDPNGWVGPDAATLVRVKQARSSLLVTVYQASGSVAQAPQLQVVRISGAVGPVEAAEMPQPTEPARAPGKPEMVEVVAHVYGRGDVGAHIGHWAGEPGSKRWIEGFGVSAVGDVPASDIEYQAVLGRGWLSPWSSGGQFCGSRGMSLPILGLRVRLTGSSAGTHRVVLSASFVDGSKVGPVAGDEACESPSLAALEAFHLAIEPVAQRAAAQKPRGVEKAASKARAVAKPVPTKPRPVAAVQLPTLKPKGAKSEPARAPAVLATASSRSAPARRR